MFRNFQGFILSIVTLSMFAFACNKHDSKIAMEASDASAYSAPSTQINSQPASANQTSTSIPIERKLIKEGNIRFETNNVDETKNLITQSVTKLSGYVSSDRIAKYGENIEHQLTVRVPSANFDQMVNSLSPGIKKLEDKSINVVDVTEEFIDVEARITTKKELEKRYQELLKQAKTVQDVLNIEKESTTLRSDIEALEGRLKYLKDQVSFSTLRLTYFERKASPYSSANKFTDAIKNGWDNLLSFIFALINIWPFIIIGILVVYLSRKFLFRRGKV